MEVRKNPDRLVHAHTHTHILMGCIHCTGTYNSIVLTHQIIHHGQFSRQIDAKKELFC